VKKSDKVEGAHIAQVKYYLYLLEEAGVSHPKGLIEYPKLRQTQEVRLDDEARVKIKKWIADIARITALAQCPPVINSRICKSCSYYDFCYAAESEA
jgi:CRISPR-associated exonuclease Cas4